MKSKMVRLVRRWVAKIPRIIPTILTTVLIALLTATATIPLEKWLAWETRQPLIWIIIGSSIILILILFLNLNVINSENGTSYYIRFQEIKNTEIHRKEVVKVTGKSLDFKTINAYYWDNTKDAQSGRAIDAREGMRHILEEFERCSNDDAEETGFQITPDFKWPAGIAFGYFADFRPEAVLRDSNSKSVSVKSRGDGFWRIKDLEESYDKLVREGNRRRENVEADALKPRSEGACASDWWWCNDPYFTQCRVFSTDSRGEIEKSDGQDVIQLDNNREKSDELSKNSVMGEPYETGQNLRKHLAEVLEGYKQKAKKDKIVFCVELTKSGDKELLANSIYIQVEPIESKGEVPEDEKAIYLEGGKKVRFDSYHSCVDVVYWLYSVLYAVKNVNEYDYVEMQARVSKIVAVGIGCGLRKMSYETFYGQYRNTDILSDFWTKVTMMDYDIASKKFSPMMVNPYVNHSQLSYFRENESPKPE